MCLRVSTAHYCLVTFYLLRKFFFFNLQLVDTWSQGCSILLNCLPCLITFRFSPEMVLPLSYPCSFVWPSYAWGTSCCCLKQYIRGIALMLLRRLVDRGGATMIALHCTKRYVIIQNVRFSQCAWLSISCFQNWLAAVHFITLVIS